MRCYEVTAHNADKTVISTRFAASEADARVVRTGLMEQHHLPKKQVSIVGVEITTTKPELLAWLNNFTRKFDGTVNG